MRSFRFSAAKIISLDKPIKTCALLIIVVPEVVKFPFRKCYSKVYWHERTILKPPPQCKHTHTHIDAEGTVAQDQLLIRWWGLLLLAFFRSQALWFPHNWPLISPFCILFLPLSTLALFHLSAWISVFSPSSFPRRPVFSLPVVWPPPLPPLCLLTLLLIRDH